MSSGLYIFQSSCPSGLFQHGYNTLAWAQHSFEKSVSQVEWSCLDSHSGSSHILLYQASQKHLLKTTIYHGSEKKTPYFDVNMGRVNIHPLSATCPTNPLNCTQYDPVNTEAVSSSGISFRIPLDTTACEAQAA
jgi:hypothetical protein